MTYVSFIIIAILNNLIFEVELIIHRICDFYAK